MGPGCTPIICLADPRNRDDAVVRFATLQFFCLIYLQKIAIGPSSFPLSLPMLVMFGSLCWMLLSRKIELAPMTLIFYLLFVSLCLVSELQVVGGSSLSSLMDVVLLYSFMTVSAPLPADRYLGVLNRFVYLMIFPACIITFQYFFQSLTGLGNPLNMDRILPSWLLLGGFIYEAPYHWGFAFMRPNGFFFLETSFASMFAASAAIIEITYFKRPALVALMVAATFLSLGGTGITMIIIAAPLLLARQTPRVAGLLLVVAIAGLVTADALHVTLPLLSRVSELGKDNSSGTGRLLIPAADLLRLLTDPAHLIKGTGAGSTTENAGSLWPIAKLLQEYGLATMASFIIFFLFGIVGSFNIPLKVALAITYNFTGGYLLNPVMVELLSLLCVIFVPIRPSEAGNTVPMQKIIEAKSHAMP